MPPEDEPEGANPPPKNGAVPFQRIRDFVNHQNVQTAWKYARIVFSGIGTACTRIRAAIGHTVWFLRAAKGVIGTGVVCLCLGFGAQTADRLIPDLWGKTYLETGLKVAKTGANAAGGFFGFVKEGAKEVTGAVTGTADYIMVQPWVCPAIVAKAEKEGVTKATVLNPQNRAQLERCDRWLPDGDSQLKL